MVTSGSNQDIVELARADDDVNALHGAIVTYLGRLSHKSLVDPLPAKLHAYMSIANHLEHLGDVIRNNLLVDAANRHRRRVTMSRSTLDKLRPLHEHVCLAFDRLLVTLRTGDPAAAQAAAASKAEVNALGTEAFAHVAGRLTRSEPNRLAAFQVETDVIENLKRLNTLTRRIARQVLAVEPEPLVTSPATSPVTSPVTGSGTGPASPPPPGEPPPGNPNGQLGT